MSSTSPTEPLSLARLPETLSLEAEVEVLMTTISCSMAPAFLTVNVTLPAETDLGDATILNSLSVTLEDLEAASDVDATAMAMATAASAAMRPSRPTRRCDVKDIGGSTHTPGIGSPRYERTAHVHHQGGGRSRP